MNATRLPEEMTTEHAAARTALRDALDIDKPDMEAWWRGVAVAHERLYEVMWAVATVVARGPEPVLFEAVADGAFYHRDKADAATKHADRAAGIARQLGLASLPAASPGGSS